MGTRRPPKSAQRIVQMPGRDEFIQGVDRLLAASKTLVGIDAPLRWQAARDQVGYEAKVPVAVNDTEYGDKLTVVAVPVMGTFHINLIHLNLCISRLDFDPQQPHPNTIYAAQDDLPAWVSGKHFHRWKKNKRFVVGNGTLERLWHAEELPTSIRTFENAMRWFCTEVGIALPNGNSLDYPGDLL